MAEELHEVRYLRNVRVAMRDGVRIAAGITRPAGEGRFPAIMGYTPYHNLLSREPWRPHRYMAERGYVVVQFDVRGTGDSGGHTTDIYSAEEIQDACEMVEWIAGQEWCTGNVGMWGISYGGVVGWQVAMHAPPHLKAVIIRSGGDDVYTEWTNPGGCPRPYMYENYAPLMTAYNLAPPDAELCGEEWAEIWEEHLERNAPWGIGFLTNHVDGPYWRERSVRPDYDRVKCPVLVIGGWHDWYPTALLRGFSHLKAPKRALVGPWSHYWPDDGIPGPRVDGWRECLRWFDQWLKGIDTGVLDEPPVTVFVREFSPPASMMIEDRGFYRSESDWPLPRTQYTPMHLQAEGRLTRDPCEGGDERDELTYNPAVGVAAGRHGGGPFPPWGMPLDQRPDEAFSLSYTTEPLEEDVEVTGNPTAVLHVSSTADIAYFSVRVCDVASDGTSVAVTKGGLNTSHRESHTDPTPIVPGEVYELTIDMISCAYLFPAGHRIRVNTTGADFQNAWPTPKAGVHAVHRGAKWPSRVVLPVAPPQEPRLPEPSVQPGPLPLPHPSQVERPEHTVTHDLIGGTATAAYVCRSGAGINRATFTVSRENPAEAVVKSEYEYTRRTAESEVKVETQCVTASDETTFRHLVEAEITVDGKRHWGRSWRVSVARRGC